LKRDDFHPVADFVSEPLLLVSRDGIVLAANRGAARRLGAEAAALTGSRLADIVSAPDQVASYLAACARSREPLPGAMVLRARSGAEIPCRATGALVRPPSAQTAGEVLLRLWPRTESPGEMALLTRRIEQLTAEIGRRKNVEDLLRTNREWLRVTLNSIGDGVLATDATGRIVLMNQVAERLTGWTLEQARAQPLSVVFHILNEHTRQQVDDPATLVLQRGHVVGLANHTVLVSKDGTEWPIDDSAAPILDDSSKMLGVVLIFREISDRKRMEAELERQRDALALANQRKDEFLAMLSHELRNPLAPIVAALEVMHRRGVGEETERLRRIIERQTTHMVRLVDDLLDVARVTRGKVELHKEPTTLREIVEDACQASQPLIDARQQTLRVILPEEPVDLDVDRTRVQQTLGNLLNNAAKYTPARGHLELRAESTPAEVAIWVIDDGQGISADLLPRVFELFAQAERSPDRSQGGLGIGLTVAKHLIELHGGTVSAHSAGEGKGSQFVVRLPRLEVGGARADERPPPARLAGDHHALRVLVVDDNTDAADTMSELFEYWGHQVWIAADGAAAVDLARRVLPDVVLLDIGLPGMDGYEVAKRIREQADLSGTRLVAVTGYGRESDHARSRAEGFAQHLVKPVTVEALGALLDRLFAPKSPRS
jgi:PAS domain S-box-containing protein